ncbi:hypothetical protein ACFO3J_24615 [Streptomyces polygonati]|uniref:N-acetyltransferase domain-containing protein n=1 Tax=Streptomyces polygonati TaxID=1617087 RepID=A0ABV8HUP6_9ACTN
MTTLQPQLPSEDPTLIRLTYRNEHSLAPADPIDALETWFVNADISGEERAEAMDILRPTAGEQAQNDVEVDLSVAEMVFIRVPMFSARSPWLLMDEHSARLASLAEHVLGRDDSNSLWSPDLEAMAEDATGDLLVVSEAVFDSAWRGFGLGPAVIGSAIRRLSGGCAVVAVEPWPVEGSVPTEADHRAGFARLAEMFGRLGFEYLHDDVLILDLSAQKAEDCLRTELERTESRGERYREHQRSSIPDADPSRALY